MTPDTASASLHALYAEMHDAKARLFRPETPVDEQIQLRATIGDLTQRIRRTLQEATRVHPVHPCAGADCTAAPEAALYRSGAAAAAEAGG